MKDRFKFRVWDKQRKEMFYLSNSPKPYKIPEFNLDLWNNQWELVKSYNDREINNSLLNDNKNAILLQCTGLKDKNGKLIFEGDILRYSIGLERILFRVEWNRIGYDLLFIMSERKRGIEYHDLNQEPSDDTILSRSEIKGNIYENPELMEICVV